MKIRLYSFSVLLLTFGILLLLAVGRTPGDALRLSSPVILANRAVQFDLSSQTGTGYSIEASENLSNWFLVSSGIAANSAVTIRHAAASNYPALFYRAKGINDLLPPLTVALQADTNFSVRTLVSLEGGSGVLYGRDGTRFTLNLASNSIPDARMLTLTLVTNIGGLPFARGTLGAVLLEPADLAFWGAGSLEIIFPTTIDRREVVSFFCHGDGSSFQLTPDRVGTNRVVIPVTRSGVFGSSLATTQELAQAARIEISSGQPSGLALASKRGGVGLHGSSTAECFPEKQAAADAAQRQIDAARDAKSKEIATLLGVEREKQLRSESDDSSSVLAQVADELCAFYTSQIAPRWAEAANNCALGQVLIRNTLGLERQRELLGAEDDCTALAKIPFCDTYTSCLQDIADCCGRGKKGSAKVAEVLGLQRQSQLLGLNCINQAEAQQVIELCSSNAWTGTFTMSGSGGFTTSSNLNGTTFMTMAEFKSHFTGYIDESIEAGIPVAGIELFIVGPLEHQNLYRTTTSRGPIPCSNGNTVSSLTLRQSDTIIATNTVYKVFVGISDDGTYTLTAINLEAGHPQGNPWGTYESIYYSRQTACNGADVVNSVSSTSPSSESGRGFNLLFADRIGMTSSNVISGSHSITNDLTLGFPTRYDFNWNFTRREAAP